MGGNALRALVDEGSVLLPGVWDALSARLVHRAGIPAAFVSGYAVSGTLLGLPDFGYLTQTEITDAARDLVAAVPGVPVIVEGLRFFRKGLVLPKVW
mgnify:CR=1 FL=1